MNKIIFIVLLVVFSFLSSFNVYALPTCADGDVCLESPIDAENPQELIGIAIRGLLGIVGSLALIMFIYGGFTWMLAAGSAEKVQKGKNILIWATIGLVVIFSAYALVRFVFEGLGITQ
ncbi:MAG: hypothetical protein V1867_03310 [Candidatus Falkowbacteria bacterium]